MYKRTFALAAGVTALLIAVGCGGSDDKSDSTADASSPATTAETASGGSAAAAAARASVKVAIKNFKFGPPNVTVKTGGTITWTNSDAADHTATAASRSFDTGTLQHGDSKTETFDKAGTYAYSCQFHPFMKGQIVIQ
jgi:plastocyanin